MSSLEKMADFFEKRVEGYDLHMINDVEGCKEGYRKMASLVPKGTKTLLDLGCGTGLELDEIFKILPDVAVVGIDLTEAMLIKLKEKHKDKSTELICGDYFEVPFGENKFDCAISFQTMHHFSHERKTALYKKINAALKENGIYIECDYMVETQEEEDHWFRENERLRKENNIPDGVFCHYDTPCTVDNQIKMLKAAGFSGAEMVFRMENTTILVAKTECLCYNVND